MSGDTSDNQCDKVVPPPEDGYDTKPGQESVSTSVDVNVTQTDNNQSKQNDTHPAPLEGYKVNEEALKLRSQWLSLRSRMIEEGSLSPRDDTDLEELAKQSGYEGGSSDNEDANENEPIPFPRSKSPMPNKIEGALNIRVMTQNQYRSIFRCPWDSIFPQRPPYNSRPQGGSGSVHGVEIKWDQPDNINTHAASSMMMNSGIFNLGDIRNAKQPPEMIDAKEMERHLQAQAAMANTPHYPQYNRSWNALQQNSNHQRGYGKSNTEYSNNIKQAIGLVGGDNRPGVADYNTTSASSTRDAAVIQQQQRQAAIDQFSAMVGGGGQMAGGSTNGQRPAASTAQQVPNDTPAISDHDRKLYEYYQQCIPKLKSVPVELIPQYIRQNPALATQVQALQSQIDQAHYRMAIAQAHAHQMAYGMGSGPQATGSQVSTEPSASPSHPSHANVTQQQMLQAQQQQQWQHYRQQQALYQQMAAAAQLQRQQQQQPQSMHGQGAPNMGNLGQQQAAAYYQQQQYQLAYQQQMQMQMQMQAQMQQQQQQQQGPSHAGAVNPNGTFGGQQQQQRFGGSSATPGG